MTRQFDDMDDVDEYIKLFEQATLSSFVIYSVERSYKDRGLCCFALAMLSFVSTSFSLRGAG